VTVEIPESWKENRAVVKGYSDEQLLKDIKRYRETIALLEEKNQDKARVVVAILRDRLQSREQELRRREESQTKSEVKSKPKNRNRRRETPGLALGKPRDYRYIWRKIGPIWSGDLLCPLPPCQPERRILAFLRDIGPGDWDEPEAGNQRDKTPCGLGIGREARPQEQSGRSFIESLCPARTAGG